MTNTEECIAFVQFKKDWGNQFPGLSNKGLFGIYRSMDLENRLEFLEEAKRSGNYNTMSKILKELKQECLSQEEDV